MKNRSFYYIPFFISAFLFTLTSTNLQAQQDGCLPEGFVDPLFDIDFTGGEDPCCGMEFPADSLVCYDFAAYPSVGNTFYLQAFEVSDSLFFYNSAITFTNFDTLAYILDSIAYNAGISISFEYDSLSNWVCGVGNSTDFGVIQFMTASDGNCITIDPLPHECPYEFPEVDISVDSTGKLIFPTISQSDTLFFPNCTPFTVGNLQDSLTANWMESDTVTLPPSEFGTYATYLASQSGFFNTFGCFNIECLNVEDLIDELMSDTAIEDQINAYISGQGDTTVIDLSEFRDSLQEALSAQIEEAGGTLTAFINQNAGWNLVYSPCDTSGIDWSGLPDFDPDEYDISGITPGGTGGRPEKSLFGNEKTLPNPGDKTTADLDYFSQQIAGLGLDAASTSAPTPSALKMIEQIKAGVNLYNGSQSSNIPLWQLAAGDVSVPIGLSSTNNGLKVNDHGSVVGQNWSLDAGEMITRVVKGLPDEYTGTVEGIGVGRKYVITSRTELSSFGLQINIPALNGVCDGTSSIKNSILNGFGIKDINLAPPSKKVLLSFRWYPLNPNFINIKLKLLVKEIFGISIYITASIDAGFYPNQELANVKYEEKGVGFLYTDDNTIMNATLGMGGLSSSLVHQMYPSEKKDYLKTKHPNRWIEDASFLNYHAASLESWIEAFQKELVYKTTNIDSEPDEFYYNIDGYSGKFSFNADGEIVMFPENDLDITWNDVATEDNRHIVSFEIETPKGMKYSFGEMGDDSGYLTGVDTVHNTNYYMPNFYTYPEIPDGQISWSNNYGEAQIDRAFIRIYPPTKSPFTYVYSNTYERNYKVMEAPTYTSAWHVRKKQSRLSNEVMTFEYQPRHLTFYSDKSYSHIFPNFGIVVDTLKSRDNGDLNPVHAISTKWQSGRAEFSYSVTEANTLRWDIKSIDNNRGEEVRFEYNKPRQEIVNDSVCSKVLVYRQDTLYKGWQLNYDSLDISLHSECGELYYDTLGTAPASMEYEAIFDLGEPYELKNHEFHPSIFIDLSFNDCINFKIPIYFDKFLSTYDKGGRTQLGEYSSLREVKELLHIFDESKEDSIFSNENNRTFLLSVQEIDINNNLHDFITKIDYGGEESLPKRFTMEQDLFGYFNDNSASLSPFPPLTYEDIFFNTVDITDSLGLKNIYGFYNVDAPNGMVLGQNEESDLVHTQIGTIHSITLATGAKVTYTYDLNELVEGSEKGGGLRVKTLTEDPASGDVAPARITSYLYYEPTFINKPIRLFQEKRNNYYWKPNSGIDFFLEQKVITTSGAQNMLFPNRSNIVGYEKVEEAWVDIGKVTHYFTTPDNYSEHIGNMSPSNCSVDSSSAYYHRANWYRKAMTDLGSNDWEFETLVTTIPPSFQIPDNFSYLNFILGVEYKTETYSASQELLKKDSVTFQAYKPIICPDKLEGHDKALKFSKSVMYQNNYAGNFNDNFFYRQLPSYLPYGKLKLAQMILKLVKLLGGTLLDHPYKQIGRFYTIGDYQLQTTYIQSIEQQTTEYFDSGNRTVINSNVYDDGDNYERVLRSIRKATPAQSIIDSLVVTAYAYPDTTGLEELNYFTSSALTQLESVANHVPISSRTLLGATYLTEFNCIAKDLVGGRIVPLSNWIARNGGIALQGKFDDYNANGLPQKYYLAKYGADDNSVFTDSTKFFDVIELTWNNQLQLESRTYGDFTTTNYYNSFFELEQTISPDNIVAKYGYDSRRRLSEVASNNDNQTTTYSYGIAPGNNFIGSSTSFADNIHPPQGILKQVDGFGRMLTVTRHDGAQLEAAEYDKNFRKIVSYNLQSGKTVYTYEASPLPRTTTVKDVLGNEVKTITETNSTFFNTTAVTDPNGYTSTTCSDALGRLVKQESGAGGTTTYSYDGLGRLSGITNPIGENYNYTYNDMDRLATKEIPGAATWYFYWDYSFRPHVIQRSNGEQEVIEYDKYNRILGIYNPSAPISYIPLIVQDDYAAFYYNDNRAVKKNTYVANKTWTRIEKDRILTPGGLGGWKSSGFVRDDIGRVTFAEIVYDNLYKVYQSNTYSDANLLESMETIVNSPAMLSDTVGFGFEFNDVLLPTKTSMTKSGETTILSLIGGYERDLVQNKFIGHSGDNGYVQAMDYGYDELGRLIRINFPGTAECLIDDGFCSMSGTVIIKPSISGECGYLTSIILEENEIPVSPAINLNILSGAIQLEQVLDSLLQAYGYFGNAHVEVETDGIPALGDPIQYNIFISNTTVDKVVFPLVDAHGEKCAKGFGLSQGICCEPELLPTGTGGTPQLAYSPNPSLFYEKLTYDGIDIDQIDMSLDCNLGMLRNVYAYDGDHRILEQANTLLGTVHIPDAYSTSYTYDPAGNIQTLNRRGFTGMLGNAMQFNDIDSLAYTYVGGSKLDTIYDSITTDSLRAFGYPLQSGAYGYDGAGNITYNPVTSASIDYNMIDLPVHIAGNKDFDYLYTYSGEKFREIRYDGDTTIRTYIGAMQYVNDTLESVHHADGRLLMIQGDTIPHYQYKVSDHLGNTVAFFEDFNGDGFLDSTEVLLKKLYYPFGMELEGVMPDTTAPNFIHLYNGKEFNEELGWYDYGARWYDPVIGRWNAVDPIAEKFPEWSPYNYTFDNPIQFIDLDGLEPVPISSTTFRRFAHNLGLSGNQQIGAYFERLVIASLQTTRPIVHNTRENFFSSVRQRRNGGLPESVRPDGISIYFGASDKGDVFFSPAFFEAKATSATITKGYRKSQITGMIDVLANMDKRERELASLTLITTSNTNISDKIIDYATKRNVVIFQSIAAIDDETGEFIISERQILNGNNLSQMIDWVRGFNGFYNEFKGVDPTLYLNGTIAPDDPDPATIDDN